MSTIKADTVSNLAGSSTTSMNTVVNGSAKAWVNFNGVGAVAIRSSYNVSSITDNGVGIYVVNFASAMPDINYSMVGSSDGQAGVASLGIVVIQTNNPFTTTTASLTIKLVSEANADKLNVCLAFFR